MDDLSSLYDQLAPDERALADWQMRWWQTRRPHQIPPEGDWTIWLMLAGRGAGKTRTAAEMLGAWAATQPKTRWLVSAPTYGDLISVCFEGDSGLLNSVPHELIERTASGSLWNKGDVEITLKNGSLIKGITAEKPERFRGPQFHGGWLDELAAWQRAVEAFDLLMFGMRLGQRPRLICTTTPKPNQIVRQLLAREKKDVSVTRATTYDNIDNLAPTFREQILQYEGTTIGRQEIYAEVISPEEMGVIRKSWIKMWPHDRAIPELDYIVMSLDTAFTEETGSTAKKGKSSADYTACVVWGVFTASSGKRSIILLDCWQERLGFPELIDRTKRELKAVYAPREKALFKPLIGPAYMEDSGRKPDILLIEDKGSGISLRQALAKEGVISAPYNPGRARKLDRLHAISPLFASGHIWVVESDKTLGHAKSWAQPLIEQLCTFSGEGSIPHDDLMDAAVQGLRYLADRDMIATTKREPDPEAAREPRPKGNPYAV
jgi:predicted phage terminase large subunit-like protein